MTFLCWHKMLVLSLCRYVWVFDEACGKGPNIDHWETPQFMVPTKKALFVRYEWNHFIVLSEKPTHFILPNKILRSEVSKSFRRSIKITLVCFPFSPPFKIKSVNWDKTCICGMICSKTWLVAVQHLISLKIILRLVVNGFFHHLWY